MMSDDHEPEDRVVVRSSAWRQLFRRLPIVAAIVAATALLMVVLGDSEAIDSDLQLCLPPEVAPGASLPLRAMLYTGLLRGEGPKLLARDVDVELRSATGAIVARTRLRAANGGMVDMEGVLAVPHDLRGKSTVVARASVDDHVLRVDAQLRVRERAAGQPTSPRSLRATQHLVQGPVQPEAGHVPPSSLRARVGGGACAPEQPCSLLVHVGRPGAQVSLQPSRSVSAAGARDAGAVTDGITRLEVITHGPEAALRLLASREGVGVATRDLRLPVALGAPALSLEPRLVEVAASPRLVVGGEPGGCIVDLFGVDSGAEARWLRTASLSSCEQSMPLPFGDLAGGLYRVQVRRDPLSASTAAVAAFYVRDVTASRSEVLAAVASQVRSGGHVDAFGAEVLSGPDAYVGEGFDAALRYLLAALESDLVVYPAMVTGYTQSLYRRREQIGEVRGLALVAVLLAGFALALFVGRRGLRASERASAILIEAGQDPRSGERSHTRSVLAVAASVLAIVLVFVVVGLYVMARGVSR